MIEFKDFVPQMTSPPGFLRPAEYGTFEDAVRAASNWIENRGVEVVTLETVVLPNFRYSHEEGSTDPSIRTSGEMASTWHQFLRVWYRA